MKYLWGMLFFLISGPALTADYVIKICDIQAMSYRDDVYIQPCDQWQSKNGCPLHDWITWDASVFQGQAMYSTAMAALLSDKNVTVRLEDNSCNTFDVTTMIRLSK